MTDESGFQDDAEAQEPNPEIQDINQAIPEENKLLIRQHLHSEVNKCYKAMISVIERLPMEQEYFFEAFKFLRIGMLLFKDAVLFSPFQTRKLEEFAQNAMDKVEQEKNATH